VVYDTILKKVRREYHAIVAEWLLEEKAERAGELTGMIGQHLELAGQTSQAVIFLRQAGELAARQYANEQAITYLSRALDLTPETETDERYTILLAREQVYSLLGARQAQSQDLNELVRLVETLQDEEKQGEVALLLAIQASERSDYQQVILQSQESIQLAERHQHPQMSCKANILWGRALLSMGEYTEAEVRFNECLSVAEANQLPIFKADSMRYLGIVDERLGNLSRAIEYYQTSLQLYRQIGDRRGEGKTLNQLGNVLLLQGDHDGGKQYYDQFLTISREIGDRWGEGQVVRNIGDIYLSQYDYRGASMFFEEALDITREIGNRTIESSALVGLGNVYLQQAEYTKARSLFEQSLNIAREIGNKPWEAKTLNQIGLFFHRQGDYVRAKSYYEQSIEIFQQLGNRLGESRVQTDLSLLYHHLGDDLAAEQTGKAAFQMVQEINHPRYLARAQIQLGRAQAGVAQYNEAIQTYHQAQDLLNELDQANLVMEVIAGLALAHLATGDQAHALDFTEQIMDHLEKQQSAQAEAGDSKMETPPESASAAVPGLEGTSDPLWIYLSCFRVLKAAQDERQHKIISSAHALLEEQAAKIEDADLRYSFLNNVKVNQEIYAEFNLGETS
jgi:tetratricopeptide (TPR) repeat protein